MAQDRTSGFDMLVQVSENEINNQLATAFLAGSIFPSSMSIPVNTGVVVGTADMNFTTPIADLDRSRPRMGITVPFVNSQLQITSPIPLTLSPLGGTIVIVDTIEVITSGTNQITRMDFAAAAPEVTITFNTASQAILAPVLTATGMTLTQAGTMLAGIVITQLQTSIQHIDLTPPIPVVDDTDPTTIFDIDVTTINDTTAADRDCISFGVRMSNASGGNINSVTTNFIPSGSDSMVMLSNFWLLARVMRPRVAAALGLSASDFDTPLRLNHNVAAPGGDGTLTNLEASVVGNRIRVTGRATDSGTGWSAVANFSFFIDLSLSGGSLNVTATTPSVDTDVDLEWWVWLLSLGLGGLFGGIAGAIVAAVVLAIVEAVAEGIVDNLISGGISGSLGGIASIPLGPIGSSISLSNIILDDLELRCSIVKSLSVPVKNQGSYSSLAGFTIDLDTGTIGSNTISATDLIWDPVSGFKTNGVTGLTISGSSYTSLGPVQISRFSLSGHSIASSLVPYTFPPSSWLFPHSEIVFGVRTTDGRLAKVRAWRSLTEGYALHMNWITYDTPVPKLDIAARWSICERGEITEYIRPDCSYCKSSPVRRCGIFEAWPRLMAFPIDYQWCLCGKVLEEGDGSIDTSDGPLTYSLKGRRLCIETEMGQSIDCELCVSAIDVKGHELFTCIHLSEPGIDVQCRKCVPSSLKMQVAVIPAETILNAWRPLIAVEAANIQEIIKQKE